MSKARAVREGAEFKLFDRDLTRRIYECGAIGTRATESAADHSGANGPGVGANGPGTAGEMAREAHRHVGFFEPHGQTSLPCLERSSALEETAARDALVARLDSTRSDRRQARVGNRSIPKRFSRRPRWRRSVRASRAAVATLP